MIGSLASAIAGAALAVIGLAVEEWRESAAYRAAKLLAWLGLDDAERRAHGQTPRRWFFKRRRAKRLLAAAIAWEGVTKHQCDCLEAEVRRRVAEVVSAAVAAARD